MNIKQTTHNTIIGAAQKMTQIENDSVDLVVTSPPYPMIEMWDDIMALQNTEISFALSNNKAQLAFELMHFELDKIWSEVARVLKNGGFACINIGDATRTINNQFALYPNHSRIISAFQKLQIPNLPNIIWRKQTNAPNKFMGSGMLPSGAYVTLEHEWILIFRKGGKREFKNDNEKLNRQESSYFWEERNIWFSDLWDLKGTKQNIDNSKSRKRSAAYPFELPYRLINMYSVKNDVVLDPFLGTGTTTLAAMASQRNSIGYEIDQEFLDIINENIQSTSLDVLNSIIDSRINNHYNFIIDRINDPKKKNIKYFNDNLKLPVITSQEKNIKFDYLQKVVKKDNTFIASYSDYRPTEMVLPKMNNTKKEFTLFD
ncbi:MAG: site-specific DNA-methyltransferase [Gelidibacter sp.]